MKKYLICIILLMSALCVYSQTDSILERRNYLEGDFTFNSNDSKIYKPNNNTSVNESYNSTILAFTYGFWVKKNIQHGIGMRIFFYLGKSSTRSSKSVSIGGGVFYHGLYQKYLNKKLAVFGSWRPEIISYGVNNIKTNNSVNFSINNNLEFGLSYDLNKNWTIRSTFLDYGNGFFIILNDNNSRKSDFYTTSNSLSLRSFVNGISIRYYY